MRRPTPPPLAAWRPLLDHALAEDLGSGDVTSATVVPEDARAEAIVEAREPLVVCGVPIAAAVVGAVDPELRVVAHWREGEARERGLPILAIEGSLRSILAAERTVLNFLGRLSGVATLTRRFVQAVAGTGCRVVDTRKTLPGWRVLDKYATAVGGAENHRMGLFDALLIKDNHLAIAGGVAAAVKTARSQAPPHLRIQVEVESEEDAAAAVEAGAEWLLLDNCSPAELAAIARRFGDRVVLEASGGVTLETVRAVAETGVHRVSVGALTHSARSSDVALAIEGLRAS
jgi:nicotinate-nucleotide pyrophosphorylase (carboxylating)